MVFLKQDWWNASSFGEYWRKWNLPIHHFLNRHVNKPLRRASKLSGDTAESGPTHSVFDQARLFFRGCVLVVEFPKIVATTVVFLISAVLHEYMITVPLQLGWTGWVFFGFLGKLQKDTLLSCKARHLMPSKRFYQQADIRYCLLLYHAETVSDYLASLQRKLRLPI